MRNLVIILLIILLPVLTSPQPELELWPKNVSCIGDCDGSVWYAVHNITYPATFEWSGPGGYTSTSFAATNEYFAIENLCPGNYYVTITDASSTVIFDTIAKILEPEAIVSNIDQAGNELYCSVNGGTLPYYYEWNTAEATEYITVTVAGIYWCIVSDENGCVADTVFFDTTEEHLNLFPTDVSCSGECDGDIWYSASNIIFPATVYWTGPDSYSSSSTITDSNLISIDNLCPGNYYISVVDSLGNTYFDTTAKVLEPEVIIPEILQFDEFLWCDVSGGTEPYSYEWNTSASEDYITITVNGLYWCIVTDDSGCISDTAYFTVTPTNNEELVSNISQNLRIYPNPTNSDITILNSFSEPMDFELFSILGQCMLQGVIHSNNHEINISDLPPDIYILKIENTIYKVLKIE